MTCMHFYKHKQCLISINLIEFNCIMSPITCVNCIGLQFHNTSMYFRHLHTPVISTWFKFWNLWLDKSVKSFGYTCMLWNLCLPGHIWKFWNLYLAIPVSSGHTCNLYLDTPVKLWSHWKFWNLYQVSKLNHWKYSGRTPISFWGHITEPAPHNGYGEACPLNLESKYTWYNWKRSRDTGKLKWQVKKHSISQSHPKTGTP